MKHFLAFLLLATAANANTYEYKQGLLSHVKAYCAESGGSMARDYGCIIKYERHTLAPMPSNGNMCVLIVNDYYVRQRAKVFKIMERMCK